MAGRKAVPPLGLGVYLPPPPPTAAVEDPIDEELRKAIRRAGGAAALAKLAGGADPAAVAQQPQPATVQDRIALDRDDREASREAREAAMEMAEIERQRRLDAEEGTGLAVQAAVERERTAADKALEIVKAVHEGEKEMLTQITELRVGMAQSEAARIAAEMKAENDRMRAEMGAQIDKRDTTIAQQQQQIEALKGKKSWGEVVAEKLESGDLSHPAVKAMIPQLAAPAGPQPKTPQDQLDEGMVPIELEDQRERRRLQRELLASEKERNDRFGQAALQVAGALRSGSLNLRGVVPGVEELDQQAPDGSA